MNEQRGAFRSGGEGWWQASDGLWYPPELSPDWERARAAEARATRTGLSLKAVVGLILGLLGFVGWIASVPAVFVSLGARRDIRESEGRLRGAGLATAGLVLGVVWAVVASVLLILIIRGGDFSNITGV